MVKTIILYFDISCLNRPFDDQSQPRVRLEAEAVVLILERVDRGVYRMFSSEMATIEVEAIIDADRRRKVLALLPDKNDIMKLDEAIFRHAARLEQSGFKPADAVHIAAAEKLGVDVLLSCDDRMCKRAGRLSAVLHVRVVNPLIWLREHPNAENA